MNKLMLIIVFRYQLICRSPVFNAMFLGELAEKGDVKVDDIDPEAFRQMLKYVFSVSIQNYGAPNRTW